MKTDDLINALAQDAAVRWRFGHVLSLALVGGAVIAATAFFLSMGFRPDILFAVATVRFVCKIGLVLCLAITAIGMRLPIPCIISERPAARLRLRSARSRRASRYPL